MAVPPRKGYGLVLKTKQTKSTLDSLAKLQRPSVFDEDDDDDKVDTNMLAKAKLSSSESRIKKQAEREHERALAEDPSVFDYDAVYDDLQASRNAKAEEETTADKQKKPKYVEALMKAHARRELEHQTREERKQQKERETEGAEFKDKDVFVTGAYRKQMEEMEKFKETVAKEEQLEALTDVTKQKSYLSGFYRNILNEVTGEKEPKNQAPATTVKQEPKDNNEEKRVRGSDSDGEKETEKPSSKKEKRHTQAAKKAYRQRARSSSSSDDDGRAKPSTSKSTVNDNKKTIYSSDSGGEESDKSAADNAGKKRGLRIRSTVTAVKQSEKDGAGTKRSVTHIEQQKRFFTPTPPSSPETSKKTTKEDKVNKSKHERSKRNRSRSKERSRDKKHRREEDGDRRERKRKRSKSADKPKPVDPIKERLERLRQLFKRTNTQDSIEDYRQRYLIRMSQGEIVPPV